MTAERAPNSRHPRRAIGRPVLARGLHTLHLTTLTCFSGRRLWLSIRLASLTEYRLPRSHAPLHHAGTSTDTRSGALWPSLCLTVLNLQVDSLQSPSYSRPRHAAHPALPLWKLPFATRGGDSSIASTLTRPVDFLPQCQSRARLVVSIPKHPLDHRSHCFPHSFLCPRAHHPWSPFASPLPSSIPPQTTRRPPGAKPCPLSCPC
ncbi:hypothetical protein BD289DRAFT_23649 [Coniella lustricola]|uniref:Uncharacterized protein n=1 Tax=Coniella lustricola TaxID=2025994 RepID=A0A2T3A3E3_9PEZI|nr:hypothetical protein BD289DRAFT_23649 [Coniella lustricola]